MESPLTKAISCNTSFKKGIGLRKTQGVTSRTSCTRENECMQRGCMQYCVYFTKMGRYMHCVYERVRRNATKNRKVKKESA